MEWYLLMILHLLVGMHIQKAAEPHCPSWIMPWFTMTMVPSASICRRIAGSTWQYIGSIVLCILITCTLHERISFQGQCW